MLGTVKPQQANLSKWSPLDGGFQQYRVTGVYWWCDRRQKQLNEFWSAQGSTVRSDLDKLIRRWFTAQTCQLQGSRTQTKKIPPKNGWNKTDCASVLKIENPKTNINFQEPTRVCIRDSVCSIFLTKKMRDQRFYDSHFSSGSKPEKFAQITWSLKVRLIWFQTTPSVSKWLQK